MNTIIKGTTPTIQYILNTVSTTDISVAYLTIQNGQSVLEKDMSAATVGAKDISWKLSQAETLAFGEKIIAECNWKTADGTRGSSGQKMFLVARNSKEVVI